MSNFQLEPIKNIMATPYKSNWLIKDFFETDNIAMIFGAPASAKSFVVLDIGFCVATGLDWNGFKTSQGAVIYIAGEGHNGLKKRIAALEIKYNQQADNMFLSTVPANLSEDKLMNTVWEVINQSAPNPALIIIDTLHRNMGSGDENSASHIATLLANIDTYLRVTGATVLIVHHTGHGQGGRARGSSSIHGALDSEYCVEKVQTDVTMKCTKMKDHPLPDPQAFTLIGQQLPYVDDEGIPVESAILQSKTYQVPVRQPILTKTDNLVLQALIEAVSKNGVPIPQNLVANDPRLTSKKYVHLDDWRTVAYTALDKDAGKPRRPATNQQALNRTKKKLLKENKISTDNDFYWPT